MKVILPTIAFGAAVMAGIYIGKHLIGFMQAQASLGGTTVRIHNRDGDLHKFTTYSCNPFCVRVKEVPRVVVEKNERLVDFEPTNSEVPQY